MYKKHKIIAWAIFLVTGCIAYCFNVNSYEIISNILTIVSIILGFYITALSSLFGNEKLREMAKKQDKQLEAKTELGVMLTYYRMSIYVSFFVITLSIILMMLGNNHYETIFNELIKILVSIVIGLTFDSLFLMFILLMLFINILNDVSKKK